MESNRELGQSHPSFGTMSFPIQFVDVTGSQNDIYGKGKQVRWTEEMDSLLVHSLITQVISTPKRVDNGFTSTHLQPVVQCVNRGSHGVVVAEKNVRARLKILKKEYLDVHELLKLSGFGICPMTGRVTADNLTWEDYIKGKPEGAKLKGKHCIFYDELEAIFGNDIATGENAQTGADTFSHVDVPDRIEKNSVTENCEESQSMPNSSSSSKHTPFIRQPRVRRRRPRVSDWDVALTMIAESSAKIAKCMELQVQIDTLNHINWQDILDKLGSLNVESKQVMTMMKIFEADNGLGCMFMGFTNLSFSREWVLDKLSNYYDP